MPTVLSKLWEKVLLPDYSVPYNCYEVGHVWQPSCSMAIIEITSIVFKQALMMYSGLYVASYVAFNRKMTKDAVLQTVNSICTSTFFLTFNGFAMFVLLCGMRSVTDRFYYYAVALGPAFLGSIMSIFLERPARRGPLAVYCANIASECLYRMAVRKDMIRPLPRGEVLIFTGSMSILLYIIRKQGFGHDPISMAFKIILGREEAKSRARRKPKLPDHKDKKENLLMITDGNTSDGTPNNVVSVCPHLKETCLTYVLKGFLRPFFLGWAAQSLLSTAVRSAKAIKKPSLIFQILKESFQQRQNIKFGLFLGTFSAVYKAVNCYLRNQSEKSEDWHALLAGLIAGPSMMIAPSTTVATYVLWKCIETVYCLGAQKGIAPFPNATIATVYAASVAVIFYTGVLEPSCLRPSYFRFIDRITDHKLHLFNRNMLTVFSESAAEGYEDYIPNLDPKYCTKKYLESVFVWQL